MYYLPRIPPFAGAAEPEKKEDPQTQQQHLRRPAPFIMLSYGLSYVDIKTQKERPFLEGVSYTHVTVALINRESYFRIGFSEEDNIDNQIVTIAEIIGRKSKVNIEEGEREITSRATVVRTSSGLIATIPGEVSQIISMNIDTAGRILPLEKVDEIKKALKKDKKRRKEKIGAR